MKYEYWFANLKGISARKKKKLREIVSSAETLYRMEENLFSEKEKELIIEHKKTWEIEKAYEDLIKKRIKFVPIWDESYPENLKNISSPPYALYVRGKLPKAEGLKIAIIGARECSAYGEYMAKEFGRELANAGVPIISGMARGIDSISQRAAIEAGGESFAVLGCGVEQCYPREEIELYTMLEEQGGIISEYPVGIKPVKQNFPARNRIISGLSDKILVMEAKEKSGSLITVDMALEQGKDVYALPGPVTSHLSRGCNNLIKQGAGILLSTKDFLDDIGFLDKNTIEKVKREKILLETTENIVYSCLDFIPQNLSDLIRKTKFSVPDLLDVLIRLELLGVAKEISKNYYVKVK